MLARHRLDQGLRAGLAEGAVRAHDGEGQRGAVRNVARLVGKGDALDGAPLAELIKDCSPCLLFEGLPSDAGPAIREEFVEVRLEFEAIAPLFAM
jgi:hypothetical protein